MKPMARALLVLLATWTPGCRSGSIDDIDRQNARENIDLAEQDIQSGVLQRALERLVAVREVHGLDPDVRAREEELLEHATRRRLDELKNSDSEELEQLYAEPLPERLKAQAGILAAERMLAEGARVSAYKMIKKVDQALPSHPERVLAGDLLARAGLSLIRDPGRYYLLLRYRTRGIQALEYLVVNYPLDPHCPEAYHALSETYEKTGELDLAIERTADLLLYHPHSPFAVADGLRLPYLRMKRMPRDDYDRAELWLTHQELQTWLERHPDHELADWGRELVRECQARLVASDLALARYHERTRCPFGAELHAERALRTARDAGLEEQAREAEGLLRRSSPPDGRAGPPADSSAEGSRP